MKNIHKMVKVAGFQGANPATTEYNDISNSKEYNTSKPTHPERQHRPEERQANSPSVASVLVTMKARQWGHWVWIPRVPSLRPCSRSTLRGRLWRMERLLTSATASTPGIPASLWVTLRPRVSTLDTAILLSKCL